MPCVGFEPTIPASERAKTVHSLDRSATVTGTGIYIPICNFYVLHHLITETILLRNSLTRTFEEVNSDFLLIRIFPNDESNINRLYNAYSKR
jgi:hypothetical protein